MAENGFEIDYALVADTVTTKEGVLDVIADTTASHPHVDAYTREQIKTSLADREQVGSTGFGDGIAIPHCSLPDASGFVIGVLSLPQGVPFDAADGKPVLLAFFIIGPESERSRHIEILSGISRLLADKRFIKSAVQAKDSDSLNDAVDAYAPKKRDEIQAADAAPEGESKSLIHVFLQRDELLPDILETLSAAPYGSFSVVEMKSAGAYMRKLPLFSAFWTDSDDSGINGHLIIATVDTRLCNDLIRRIRSVPEGTEDMEGLLVTVQDTSFTFGSLRF